MKLPLLSDLPCTSFISCASQVSQLFSSNPTLTTSGTVISWEQTSKREEMDIFLLRFGNKSSRPPICFRLFHQPVSAHFMFASFHFMNTVCLQQRFTEWAEADLWSEGFSSPELLGAPHLKAQGICLLFFNNLLAQIQSHHHHFNLQNTFKQGFED